MPNTSIAITVKDEVSSSLNAIRTVLESLGRGSKEAAKDMDQFRESGTRLQIDARRLTGSLENTSDALQKAGRALGGRDNPFVKVNLKKTREEFRGVQNELLGISNGAQEAQKQLLQVGDLQSKIQSRTTTFSGLATKLSPMVTEALEKQVKVKGTSLYGEETGNMISSILSGAATGAIAGSVVPGLGNAIGAGIGAVIGAVSGVVSAEAEKFEKQDDAFKEYVSGQYNDIQEKTQNDIEAGSSIAAAREQYRNQFATVFGGAKGGDALLNSIRDFSLKTPIDAETMNQGARQLLDFGVDGGDVMEMLTALGTAAQGNSTKFSSLTSTFAQVSYAGKLTENDLKQFISAGFDPLSEMAQINGTSVDNLRKRMNEGKITADEVADAFVRATQEGSKYDLALKQQRETYSGSSAILQNWEQELQAALGEGYNETSIKNNQKQSEFLSGEAGQNMLEANRAKGEYYAELEGLEQDYRNAAINAVITGRVDTTMFHGDEIIHLEEMAQKYQEAKTNGDKYYGRFIDMAEQMGINAYNADDRVQSELDTMIDMANTLRNNAGLQSAYYDAGYRMGQEFTKGILSAHEQNGQAFIDNINNITQNEKYIVYDGVTAPDYLLNMYWGSGASASGVGFGEYAQEHGYFSSRAIGIPYIPRDDYLIRAHEGERLLTADEARRYNAGGSGTPVLVTMNGVTIREEADIDKVASELAWQIHKQQMIGVAM